MSKGHTRVVINLRRLQLIGQRVFVGQYTITDFHILRFE